jgi:FkbM family methyltransferase
VRGVPSVFMRAPTRYRGWGFSFAKTGTGMQRIHCMNTATFSIKRPEWFEDTDCMRLHNDKVFAGEYDIPGLEIKGWVYDIGANVGAFSLWACERWPQCFTMAYEPQDDMVTMLRRNLPESLRASYSPMGLLALPEDVETKVSRMYRGLHNVGEASMKKGHEQSDEQTDLCLFGNVRKLHSAQFLKIDTEGCEEEIVLAYPHWEDVQGVALEYHSLSALDTIRCFLKTKGFVEHSNTVTDPSGNRGLLKMVCSSLSHLVPSAPRQASDVGEESQSATAKARAYTPAHDASRDCSDVFIAIPVHYDPTGAFTMSLQKIPQSFPGAHIEFLIGDSHPDRARNKLVNKMLRGAWQYLLFLDADLAFEASQIRRLLDHQKDVVCGFYARKKPGRAEWICNPMDAEPNEEGLVRMWESGTGCMLIHRRVFEKLIQARPDCAYLPDGDERNQQTEYALFDSGAVFDRRAGRRRWMSEDWMFCMRARDCGFTIYGDPTVILMHEGRCFFPTES